jgi:hypothetical protein
MLGAMRTQRTAKITADERTAKITADEDSDVLPLPESSPRLTLLTAKAEVNMHCLELIRLGNESGLFGAHATRVILR